MPSVDVLFDDMINDTRNSGRGRGQGRAQHGRGPGGSFKGGMIGALLRGPLRVNARPSSNAIAMSFRRAKSFPWQRDLFEDSLRVAGLTGVENGTKLFVSNLDIGVTNEDIRELFSEIGELKQYAVHYGKNGCPSGSAEVVFARRSDAFKALKRYNTVQLDGRPMKVEIIGTHSEIPVSARVNGRRVVTTSGGCARGSAAVNRARGSAAVNRGYGQRSRGDLRNGRGGTCGRGRGGGWKKAVEKTADELDKELENYHADAMHT